MTLHIYLPNFHSCEVEPKVEQGLDLPFVRGVFVVLSRYPSPCFSFFPLFLALSLVAKEKNYIDQYGVLARTWPSEGEQLSKPT